MESSAEKKQKKPGSQKEEPGTPDSPSPVGDEGSEDSTAGSAQQSVEEFTDPILRGKSPAEIEAMFDAQRRQVREYGHNLSELNERVKSLDDRTKPQKKEPSAEDYWSDPVATTRRMMEDQIAPLKEEITGAIDLVRGGTVDDQMRRRFSDWDELRPEVDVLLDQGKFPDRNDVNTLAFLYYAAKGVIASQGGQAGAAAQVEQKGQSMPPPQHRASSPPPPQRVEAGQGEKKFAPLTENEKVLAKMYGMTAQEYRDWQSKTEDEEAGMDFITGEFQPGEAL